MPARLLVLFVGIIAVFSLSACGNPFAVNATAKNIDDTLVVYALSEAPLNAPTALNTFIPVAVRTDPTQNYDLVFDIRPDSTGTPTAYVLPPRAVANTASAGIIRDSTQAFEDIKQAPVNGYNDSTIVPIKKGDVLIVQSQSFACTQELVTARQFIYSKIVIDSINFTPYDAFTNPDGSTIRLRIRVDPNCGFISFLDGLPTF